MTSFLDITCANFSSNWLTNVKYDTFVSFYKFLLFFCNRAQYKQVGRCSRSIRQTMRYNARKCRRNFINILPKRGSCPPKAPILEAVRDFQLKRFTVFLSAGATCQILNSSKYESRQVAQGTVTQLWDGAN
jgi:hypothetical protein